MKYIASFSGGKDSAAMLLLILEKRLPLDEIIFIDTGVEFDEIYNIIDDFEKRINFKITRIKAEKNFEEYFYTVNKRGKRKGQIRGFPYTLGAWCNSSLKRAPANKYFNSIGEHKRYIGIAFDELNRYKRLEKNFIAPLYEEKMTESDCLKYLEEKGFYYEIHHRFKRTGCYLCPKQSLESLRILRKYYPDLWESMLKLDKDSPTTFKANGTTVHDLEKRFRNEDIENERQISFFQTEKSI
ncbi:TPA: phosphoadenosine phosphosulfate reductase family protein [Clostridioides difficile]|nr:phosphoadenosine phosphosulfate reductase family protein [Clostridioides difficile]HBF3642632.1 phosphoadenosine phosphosulfate reductase family protein [Clostridioides difficile]HBF9313192.1 phosphoadenosine phosphosulfate reductase family protein [Clostridioides difficile]HBG3281674.1 phosphoadenosine phosphosulfate reductase family protein [Clostridioides difficile]HCQ6119182.1 phosphoadenosine phosphosulfate reductase family protein [Clostridioides difficile]